MYILIAIDSNVLGSDGQNSKPRRRVTQVQALTYAHAIMMLVILMIVMDLWLWNPYFYSSVL